MRHFVSIILVVFFGVVNGQNIKPKIIGQKELSTEQGKRITVNLNDLYVEETFAGNDGGGNSGGDDEGGDDEGGDDGGSDGNAGKDDDEEDNEGGEEYHDDSEDDEGTGEG